MPTGSTEFELDFLDDIAGDFSDSMQKSDSNFQAGEQPEGSDGYGDGDAFRLFAELTIDAPNLVEPPTGSPDGFTADIYFEGTTNNTNISDVLGPIPQSVNLQDVPGVPGWAWYEGAEADNIEVRIEATWTDSDGEAQSEYLMGDSGSFQTLETAQGESEDFNLVETFNDRPEDLVLNYELAAETDDSVDSFSLRFEIPFAFEALKDANLDFAEEGGDPDDGPLVMDEDIFQRDPADPDEDLEDFLDSLRGSSATFSFDLENSTGFGISLGMVEKGTSADKEERENWLINTGVKASETLQTVKLDLSQEALEEMIDGTSDPDTGAAQYVPEFLIQLPQGDFQMNRGGAFNLKEGYLRANTDIDHTFSFGDEE